MNNDSSKEMKRYNFLHGEIEGAYHEASLKFGMPDSILKVLYAVCSLGDNLLLSDIYRNTGLSRQTVNSALRRLESDDVIYLEAVNGKSKKACLSEKGKRFVGDNVVRLIEIENSIYRSWPESDIQKYLELTERFLASLKEKVREL